MQARGKSRGRWRQAVAAAAAAAWPAGVAPLLIPVKLDIVYFYSHGTVDIDNIIKPIQDALIGIAYDDDSRVVEVRAVRRDLASNYVLSGPSAQLLAALVPGTDFVHISVEDADLQEPVP